MERSEEELADRREEKRRPVEEAGGGEAEGFEQSEEGSDRSDAEYGEPDEEDVPDS